MRKSHTGRYLRELLASSPTAEPFSATRRKLRSATRYCSRRVLLRAAEEPFGESPTEHADDRSAISRRPCNHAIAIHGAREHNLKNISLAIPRDQMVVITGLSGSGKSTLAFDLLFAEGQRRFLDSMSPYARQFVEQLEKPDVDLIEGLPPSRDRATRHARRREIDRRDGH